MSNLSMLFRIISISVFSVDIIAGVYLLITWIMFLAEAAVLGKFQLILFIIVASINILYIAYLSIVLLRNKYRKKC